MNITNLYNHYGIQVASESDKHYRDGWVNTPCPFCTGNQGHHLGYNTYDNYFRCWRCGFHPTLKVLQSLLNLNYNEAKKILYEYKGKTYYKTAPVQIRKKAFKTPSNLKPISEVALASIYLRKRGFDPLLLESKYNLKASGPISYLDDIDFRFRIFAPIYFNGEMVSWQTRDYTGKSTLKYISCPSARELIKHKHILYQLPDTGFIVFCEGIFDVWKVEMAGYPATCCFGIDYLEQQMKLLIGYEKIIIFFDSEKQARERAEELKERLLFIGKEVISVYPPEGEDAGSLTVNQIKELLK